MLVKNFKGIGWKEASHFLRNVGLLDVAILDKHILRLMHHYKLIENMPKGWTRARYEAHEQLLIPIVQKLHMDLGEMDLYLWYAVFFVFIQLRTAGTGYLLSGTAGKRDALARIL